MSDRLRAKAERLRREQTYYDSPNEAADLLDLLADVEEWMREADCDVVSEMWHESECCRCALLARIDAL